MLIQLTPVQAEELLRVIGTDGENETLTEITLAGGYDEEPRGEYVILVEGAAQSSPYLSLSPEEHLKAYLDAGMDKKTAVKKVAAERGVPKDDIYQLTVKSK